MEEEKVQTVKAKHIFIDIVSYTHERCVEAQTELISFLNDFVRTALEEKKIKPEEVIFIPTGDGMCISLLNVLTPYDIHMQIALSILKKIYVHNNTEKEEMLKFEIRIGINENTDNLIIDINGHKNISGSGINEASRIEGLCDSSQILVGDSVFKELVPRKKYMKSFKAYTTQVKHGLSLKVHQYRNKELKYLNSEIPSKFKPAPTTPQKEFKLSEIQAYYIANCIMNKEFISKNIGDVLKISRIQILLILLTKDSYDKARETLTNPNQITRVDAPLQKFFERLALANIWVNHSLNRLYNEKYLNNIQQYFSDKFLFVNETGKKKFKEDFPEIYKQFKIED